LQLQAVSFNLPTGVDCTLDLDNKLLLVLARPLPGYMAATWPGNFFPLWHAIDEAPAP
jgi:hypothetical protein